MLLKRLLEYSERLPLPPPMYQWTPIKWLIDLDRKGHLLGFVATTGDEGGKRDRGMPFLAPHVVRAYGIKPKLLADRADYALGVLGADLEDRQRERVQSAHEEFVDLIRRCAEVTGEPAVLAVRSFLESPGPLSLPEDLNPADGVTFRVAGALPIDLASVRRFWASQVGTGAAAPGSVPTQCLVCGSEQLPVEREPIKIKRIPGGQTSGMALVSANAPAFESYGRTATLIAPICQQCAERYGNALNALLADDSSHLTVGPLVYVFWTREPTVFSVARLLSDPKPEDVKALLTSVYSGRRQPVDDNAFFMAALSSSGGRVAVREWHESSLGEVRASLARYFALQQVVDWDGTDGRPLGVYALSACVVREMPDLPANVPRAILNLALKGGSLPAWILYQAIKRARAEQRVTRPRVALIKLAILSLRAATNGEDRTMERLDVENRNPAYLCGRLLALLESIQHAAVPGARATILDRYYGTASSAPASVFGRLLRTSQSHLGKLRKERPGWHSALQMKLESILARLDAFPAVLTLEEQGIFAVGYYHQRAEDRSAALARKKKPAADGEDAETEEADPQG